VAGTVEDTSVMGCETALSTTNATFSRAFGLFVCTESWLGGQLDTLLGTLLGGLLGSFFGGLLAKFGCHFLVCWFCELVCCGMYEYDCSSKNPMVGDLDKK
jgi:hypothetical protein